VPVFRRFVSIARRARVPRGPTFHGVAAVPVALLICVCLGMLPVLEIMRRQTSIDPLIPDPVAGHLGLNGSLLVGFSAAFGDLGVALLIGVIVASLALAGSRVEAALALAAFVAAELLDRLIKVLVRAPRPALDGDPGYQIAALPASLVILLLGALVLAALAPRWRRRSLAMAASLGLAIALARAIHAVLPVTDGRDGFPSGHATGSMVVAAITVAFVAPVLRRWPLGIRMGIIGASVILVLGVGMSRLYLDAHYPADVLAGWCVAIAATGGAFLGRAWLTTVKSPVPSA
jgi:membrane-associated phospholipid phosphatase